MQTLRKLDVQKISAGLTGRCANCPGQGVDCYNCPIYATATQLAYLEALSRSIRHDDVYLSSLPLDAADNEQGPTDATDRREGDEGRKP